MKFPLFDDVIVKTDFPDQGICAGDIGTVVEHHVCDGKVDGYSVEFFDMTGRTVAVATLSETSLRAPTSADRPSVRAE